MTDINWKDINKQVHYVLEYLYKRKKYNEDIKKFLSWYDNLNNMAFKSWLQNGITPMTLIIKDLNNEIKLWDDSYNKIIKSNDKTNIKLNATKKYNIILKEINSLIIEILGCRNKFGQWYIGLLEQYKIKNNFAKQCAMSLSTII